MALRVWMDEPQTMSPRDCSLFARCSSDTGTETTLQALPSPPLQRHAGRFVSILRVLHAWPQAPPARALGRPSATGGDNPVVPRSLQPAPNYLSGHRRTASTRASDDVVSEPHPGVAQSLDLGADIVPAVVSLPGIAGSEERGRTGAFRPNADGSGPQATGIDYRLPGWYVRIATPVGDVFESTSISRLSGFPSRKRRLPPPTTIGWIIKRYSSTRS
jgi:hypothetical protein